ncbi:MAG: PIN domain-containing protein [Nevskiaceae bacterium]
MSGKAFLDTNVLLYLLSSAAAKADRAEQLVAAGGVISVQVLNEFAATAIRKARLSWPEVAQALEAVRASCAVEPLTLETHDTGRALAMRYGFSVYDAMIVASSLLAGASVLYSEDLQDGQRVEGRLTIRNPFVRPR